MVQQLLPLVVPQMLFELLVAVGLVVAAAALPLLAAGLVVAAALPLLAVGLVISTFIETAVKSHDRTYLPR